MHKTTTMGSKDRNGMPQGGHRESSCSDDDQKKIVMGPVLDNSDGLSRSRTDHPGSKDEIIEAERERLVSADEEAGIGAAGYLKGGQSTGAKDDDGKKEEEKEITTDNSNEDSHLLQDHGWAWFVCLGGFFSHFITGGFERSDGVMFLEFTDRFKQSAQLTAWPAAICSTSRLVMGPLSTAFCNRFSARTATMVGTFVFAAGVIASGFAPSVPFLIFSYGLVQGIGRGLIYAPGLVIVGMYFNRRRGLGVGLATAGVGAGTFVFPPLVEWLFQHYGFRGAFLILGAICFNFCIVAALYRPLFVHRNIVLGSRKRGKDEEEALCPATEDKKPATDPSDHPQQPQVEIINDAFPAFQTDSAKLDSVTRDQNGRETASSQEGRLNGSNNPRTFQNSTETIQNAAGSNPTTSHKSTQLKAWQKSKTWRVLKSTLVMCFPTEEVKKDAPKRKLIEWSLLKTPEFLFFCFSICLFTLAFKSAFTFLPALAESKGVSPSESAYLLSISGILDTIGRIMAGFILDTECIRPFRPIIYNGVIFVITGLSFLSPFMENFVQFAVLFGLYGMLTGTYVSQKSVILVDILGQEKLSSSFGLLIVFQGLGTFVGPPLSGFLKDVFGRFNEAFFLGGAAMAFAGTLMVVSNVYRVLSKRRQEKSSTSVQ